MLIIIMNLSIYYLQERILRWSKWMIYIDDDDDDYKGAVECRWLI